MKSVKIKKWFIFFWLGIVFTVISLLFWHNEWVYNLPTPLPVAYHQVDIGTHISLNGKIKSGKGKPVFLHFFNPDCPCSRFNITHFKSLVRQYNDELYFAMIVMDDDGHYTAKKIQDKYGLTIPVLFDQKIADLCGVYSTPQAVILDADNKLYYRGNYNKSRYCTNKNSDYAKMAIDSLLNNKINPEFGHYALQAYGCTLPNCKK